MPPQDHATGNLLVRPMRYVRLVTAICTLLGVLGGGAIGFWTHAVAAGRAEAENAQLRKDVHDIATAVKDLTGVEQSLDRRVYTLELRSASYGGK